jgi:putative oxidoreductase
MDVIQLIGRIVFAFLLIGSAFGHLTQTEAMAGYAQSRGIPSPRIAVQVSGVALLLGGLSILLGIWGDAGSLGMAILLAILAVGMHAFWRDTDPMAKQMEMVQFNKDIALAGGALAFYVTFYGDTTGHFWTITGPLFN